MKRSFNPAQVPHAIALETVEIASPCHADWDAMRGDDRSRFCPSCAKNVYNLSAMSRGEAELLLQEKEGRLCVRFFQREDGTMLTQDCPVGAAALKERSPSFALWSGVASLLVLAGALLSPAFISGAHAQPEPHMGETLAQTALPTPQATPSSVEEPPILTRMGDVAPLPRPTAIPTSQPTVAPVQSIPLMGKPAVPAATPTPHAIPARMGRISSRKIAPTPVAISPSKDIPVATMGIVARVPATPSHPAKKSAPPTKKSKSAKK